MSRETPHSAAAARGRVLWVSTSRQTAGGMTTFVDEVSRTPLWRIWDIDFVATHRSGSVLARATAFAHGLGGFLWRIMGGRVDLVHLHTSHYGSFPRKAVLLWLAAAARLRVVLQVHAGEFPVFYRRMPRPVRWCIRRTLTRADVVVALGERCARELRAIAPGAAVIAVPNGVRIPVSPPCSRIDSAVHVVFLGQMGEMKGTFTLVEAWARLVADTPDLPPVRLTCAGDGDVAGVRDAVARLRLGDTVEVRSWMPRSQVAGLLASADVLALPSRFEGQPMAVLEAMAGGLCVVASRVGGIPDLVEDGCSGLLVPPDDIDRLAGALRRVVTDRELCGRLGTQAQHRAKDLFDIEVVWRRFDRLYRDLLEEPDREVAVRPAWARA